MEPSVRRGRDEARALRGGGGGGEGVGGWGGWG